MIARMLRAGAVLFGAMAGGLIGFGAELPKAAEREIAFGKDIKPILERSCAQCHGEEKPKGGFRVDSRKALLEGGESKEAAIIPGSGASSPLARYVADLVREMEMPPVDKRDKFPALTPTEIGLIRAWIDQGAKWPEGITVIVRSDSTTGKEPAKAASVRAPVHPLFEMIRRGDRSNIAKALKDPSVLESRDENGNTPLIQAAFYLGAKQVGVFLDKGADIHATNKNGGTALMKAVWDTEKTRLLLKRGANVNAASKNGNTPLIIACYAYGAERVVKELIAAGAHARAANKTGATAVTAAAEAGDVKVLGVLLDHHGDPNSKGRIVESNSEVSALMIASQLGHLDCVKLLLERGADINMRLEHGNALHFAAFTDRTEIARLLLDRGINVNAPGRRLLSFRKDTGLTALMYAAMSERNDSTLVQWLIERGADLNAKASSGETCLSVARRRGNTKIVSALLAAGAKTEKTEEEPANHTRLWTAEEINREGAGLASKAAEAGLSVLLKSGARFSEATGNRCASCHQQNLPGLAWSVAAKTGVVYPEKIAKEELAGGIRGAKRFAESAIEQPLPVPNIAAWLLIGLGAAGYPADTMTDNAAYSLARYQHANGRWGTKASRAPTDYSDVTSTALAIRALKLYAPAPMKKRIDRNIEKAAVWLRSSQAQSAEERAMQILGLHWAGRDQSRVKKLTQGLLAEQREDGGWAQLTTLESDAYATGLALFAMKEAGEIAPSHGAYQRGVKFLLKTQLRNGSWFVRTRVSPVQVAIDEVFSHGEHQWISSMATGWSSMALMYASTQDGASKKGAALLSSATPYGKR